MGFSSWLDKRRRTKRLLQLFVLMGSLLTAGPGIAETRAAGLQEPPAAVQQYKREAQFLSSQLERAVTHSGKVDEARLATIRRDLAEEIKCLKIAVFGHDVVAVGQAAYALTKPNDTEVQVGNFIGQVGSAFVRQYFVNKIELLEEVQDIISKIYDFDVVEKYSDRIIDIRQFQEMKRYIFDLTTKLTDPKWEDVLRKEQSNPPFRAGIQELRRAMADEILFDAAKLRDIVIRGGSETQIQQWQRMEETTGRLLGHFK